MRTSLLLRLLRLVKLPKVFKEDPAAKMTERPIVCFGQFLESFSRLFVYPYANCFHNFFCVAFFFLTCKVNYASVVSIDN